MSAAGFVRGTDHRAESFEHDPGRGRAGEIRLGKRCGPGAELHAARQSGKDQSHGGCGTDPAAAAQSADRRDRPPRFCRSDSLGDPGGTGCHSQRTAGTAERGGSPCQRTARHRRRKTGAAERGGSPCQRTARHRRRKTGAGKRGKSERTGGDRKEIAGISPGYVPVLRSKQKGQQGYEGAGCDPRQNSGDRKTGAVAVKGIRGIGYQQRSEQSRRIRGSSASAQYSA